MAKYVALGTSLILTIGCGIDEQVHKKALDDLAACQRQTEACGKQTQELQAQLDGEMELRQGSQTELASMKTNLKTTESELAELRKQREAAETRAAAYRQLTERMRALVDTGKLKVAFRKGQMVLELPSEILFGSGRAKLSKAGKAAMTEVTDILVEFKDRRFMIAGHTDNQKIKTQRFPNNWHLSTARAVSILEFFIQEGFIPENLGAAGFGEFDPISDNTTPEGRKQNRRIEIILVPDLSELPSLGVES